MNNKVVMRMLVFSLLILSFIGGGMYVLIKLQPYLEKQEMMYNNLLAEYTFCADNLIEVYNER